MFDCRYRSVLYFNDAACSCTINKRIVPNPKPLKGLSLAFLPYKIILNEVLVTASQLMYVPLGDITFINTATIW